MKSTEERLRELGIELSHAPLPLGSYVPAVTTGNLLFLSGILPLKEGRLLEKGSLPRVDSKQAASKLMDWQVWKVERRD